MVGFVFFRSVIDCGFLMMVVMKLYRKFEIKLLDYIEKKFGNFFN